MIKARHANVEMRSIQTGAGAGTGERRVAALIARAGPAFSEDCLHDAAAERANEIYEALIGAENILHDHRR